ncbi:MAG: IclR family transcriptional regulator [Pararhodobacter sp.]|nr:IclR family transcriptional regulator [Pararhodobacter sp.]
MRTVQKALKLLDLFDETRPEIGLSVLARLSGIDKATVLRMLNDMAASGLVEQDQASRNWRLGAGILRLARLREAGFPATEVINPILAQLAGETGETAHASLRAGRDLGTIGVVESARSNRVYIEPGLVLPLHATASGLAYCAFARPEVLSDVLARPLSAHTGATPTDSATLAARIDEARAQGYACADQTYEAEVFGIAMPLFGADGFACGALAVATPAARLTPELRARILAALARATREATRGMGGRIPEHHRIAA